MSDSIKPGDVVQLKSGGESMTVGSINDGFATVYRNDGTTQTVHEAALCIVEPPSDEPTTIVPG